MKKLILYSASIIFALLSGPNVSAQIFPRGLSSDNQQIIISSLEDAVRLVHIEFQLEDTVSHERFNLQGKDYFGFSEGLCIKTCKGWIAPAATVTPWKNNLEVKQYPEYKPVFSVASVLSPADTVWKPLEMKSLPAGEKISGTPYSSVADTVTFGPGLSLGEFGAENDGWIVWVAREGNKLSTTTYSHRVVMADSTSFGIGRKVVPTGVVGGFYVKPEYPSVGVIRLELVGLMDKGIDGWKVVPLEGGKDLLKKPALTPEKPKLVPAGEKKESEGTEAEAPAKDKKSKKEKKNK